MKTGAPMRRILTLLAVFTVIAFVLIVVRETAAVVTLAREFHPVAGQVTLWTLVSVYGIWTVWETAIRVMTRKGKTAAGRVAAFLRGGPAGSAV